ncbi:extracellular solute-binding protein [Georgenia phoenicis]|uniref:ABC transporter substrate-binding protein n=1 Tax=unclassified Georgenia TaxID=2626815 RepID=UPI0039AED672
MRDARPRSRRPLLVRAAALAAIGSLTLAACGQGENPADTTDDDTPTADSADGGEATIRFSWWGSDTRHQLNQELIDAFEAEHPDITVTPDYTDWGGYWDKLATQTAGGDTPDVIMQEERYLREYADRGVLADLSEYDIDTSAIDESILGSGEFNDGLWGIPTGVNVRVMMADPQVFEEAGVEMPDDTTWTWQDYHDLMVEISENTPDGVYGAQDFGFIEPDLSIWARQHGQELWDEDGEIGFEPELMAELWGKSIDLIEAGGAPSASEGLEIDAAGPEQSLVATNRSAISRFWTNQLEAISSAAGRDLQLLRYPGESEFERTGLFQKPAMALSMSAETEHPEAAATFIDWMLNSPEAGEIILSDRGLPANLDVREHVLPSLSEAEQQAAEFIEAVSADIVDAPPAPPAGAGEVAATLARYNEQVLFGQLDPQEAAEQFIAEAASMTG